MSDLGASSGSRADASSPQAVSTKGFDPERGIYANVLRSLEAAHDDWQHCFGWLRHRRTGVSVWIYSGEFGLEIAAGPFGQPLWGGVTMLSSIGLSPRHWRLNRAVRRWFERNAMSAPEKSDA